jgi:hypothetical protein
MANHRRYRRVGGPLVKAGAGGKSGQKDRTMKVYYTTNGSVRGSCHHQHQTFEAALACANKDGRQCSQVSRASYSDRDVIKVAADGSRQRVISDEYGNEARDE